MRRFSCAVAAVAILATGCGSSEEAAEPRQDPEVAIRTAFEAYQVGIWEGDHERACAQLAPGALDEMLASAFARQSKIETCEDVVRFTNRYEHDLVAEKHTDPAAADRFMQPFLHPEDLALTVTGDTAVARPFDQPVPFERQPDGAWKISAISVPG